MPGTEPRFYTQWQPPCRVINRLQQRAWGKWSVSDSDTCMEVAKPSAGDIGSLGATTLGELPAADTDCCHSRERVERLIVDSPPDHDIPLFSIISSAKFAAAVAEPAVRLSPIAPMTSISPGQRRCTLVGRVAERAPGDPGAVSHGNGMSSGTGSWNLLWKL
jgi:hypothetical protein